MDEGKKIFHPLGSRRVFERVSKEIKELVINGVFRPGDKLPCETEIAKQFNVGRQSVREALRLLEHSGMITIQQGGRGGPVVQDTIMNKISELLIDAIRVRKITLEELTSARSGIEKLILRELHARIDEADLGPLRENVAAAKKKIDNREMATEENIQFHVLLARASGNHVFLLVMETLMIIDRYFIAQGRTTFAGSKRVARMHGAILDALSSGDCEEAIRIIEKDLAEVKNILLVPAGR